jgi:regulatory protein YycI of two-component signal transduction system YycFG
MSLLPGIITSNFDDVKELIESMILTGDTYELNITFNSTPPVTLYDIAIQQDQIVKSESSRKIVNYMRKSGALTYEELLNLNAVSKIPLAQKGTNHIEKNKGIASLPRRKVGTVGGRRRRNKRKTRRIFG